MHLRITIEESYISREMIYNDLFFQGLRVQEIKIDNNNAFMEISIYIYFFDGK